MFVPVLLFVLGLVLLIKGGDWFVDGAVAIARRYHIPDILIGATVVSIGTTIPEVLVSSMAAAYGQSQTAYGNAIGSIICNTALIAAITIAVKPAGNVSTKSLRLPLGFFFAAAAIYTAVAYTTGYFSRTIGIALLCMFAVYMILTVKKAFSGTIEVEEEDGEEDEKPMWKSILLLVVGAAVIAVGADLLVDNGKIIAAALGVPESVIALTFIALGTSLPELVTAITSLAKGHSSLSLGNIIGANLFNLVLVSGTAISINPFTIPADKTIAGMNASLVVDVPLMWFVMLLLSVPAICKGKLYRFQGIILLTIYFAYVLFQFFL